MDKRASHTEARKRVPTPSKFALPFPQQVLIFSRPAAKPEAAAKASEKLRQVQIPRATPQDPQVFTEVGRASEKRLIPKQRSSANITASFDVRIADLWMRGTTGATSPCGQFTAPQRQAADVFSIPRLRFGELSTSRGLDDHVTFHYYEFLDLKSLSKVQQDDVRYLEFTGSLHIPARPVLNEIVREYFLHVHPVLPVVDERAFWAMYDDSMIDLNKPGKLSLFVFQSMLFAAAATVPLATLRCCGFSSVRQARETFYRRAKTIFDLSKESDCYAVAQGALLLTYYSTNADPNINSHWLSIAIQNARVINAQLYHRDQTISDTERRRKKRLWWSCVLRDRIMPLGCRRAIQITYKHFDFEESFKAEDIEHEIGFSRVYDAETQKQLVKTIVAQYELAVALTGVLSMCYPLDGSHSLARLAPTDLKRTKERIEQTRSKLLEWFNRFSLQALSHAEANQFHVSVTLYTDLLYVYYHSARLALCQYEIFILKPSVTLASSESDHAQSLYHAKEEMQTATAATTEIVKVLIMLKAAQYLPVSMVAYTALPLILTALNFKMSSGHVEEDARRRQLEVYVEAMRLYRKKYDGTEQLSAVVEKVLNEAEPETRRICSTSGPNSPERSLALSRKSKDWSDILNQRPTVYLRLTLGLDMALSRGKFPKATDFPASCRIAEIDGKDDQDTFFNEETLSSNYIDMTTPCMQQSTGNVFTPRSDFQELFEETGHAQVNLDFADLFGDQTQRLHQYEGPHGCLEDIQGIFDMNVPV